MRDKDRIEPFMDVVGEIWYEKCPDWRFGQLMSNFFGWLKGRDIDPFMIEEERFLDLLYEFMDDICKRRKPKPEPKISVERYVLRGLIKDGVLAVAAVEALPDDDAVQDAIDDLVKHTKFNNIDELVDKIFDEFVEDYADGDEK